MKFVVLLLIVLHVFVADSVAQVSVDELLEAEKKFVKEAETRGSRNAFLDVLTPDATLFYPEPVNGHMFWKDQPDKSETEIFVRVPVFGDVAFNGKLGYTMGNWRVYQKGKSESFAEFGQYVSVWEKRNDQFLIGLDIRTSHEKLSAKITDRKLRPDSRREENKNGWSPADASMNFLKLSMADTRLGSAYKRFAGDDMRLLIEGEPPILGKKNIVEVTEKYVSVQFPKKVNLFQAADMAYTWNVCQYENSNEGIEQGNCLHIWKLRDKEWEIVLGVFAKLVNDKKPEIKLAPRKLQ